LHRIKSSTRNPGSSVVRLRKLVTKMTALINSTSDRLTCDTISSRWNEI
jgi:hypothetical protein